MNIYFSCSITGGRQDEPIYRALVDDLLMHGHMVPTAELADANITQLEDVITAEEVYTRDTAWVLGCDVLIAEVSTPSHGVGYEIALALQHQKPILCCYQRGRRVSKMILGNDNPLLRLHAYETVPQLLEGVHLFLNQW